MNEGLIKRLRLVADIADGWNFEVMPPPVADWAVLMDEAADALEAWEDDGLEEAPPRLATAQAVE